MGVLMQRQFNMHATLKARFAIAPVAIAPCYLVWKRPTMQHHTRGERKWTTER